MNTSATIDETLCSKVLCAVDKGLTKGLDRPVLGKMSVLGKMCVEAAVNYAMGLPHGDNPPCVGKAVRAFEIRLNDAPWSSNQERANGMRKLAIAQLGSDQINQVKFAEYVIVETMHRILSIALDKAGLSKEAQQCHEVTNLKTARTACIAACNAADYNAYVASSSASIAATNAIASAASTTVSRAAAAAAARATCADVARAAYKKNIILARAVANAAYAVAHAAYSIDFADDTPIIGAGGISAAASADAAAYVFSVVDDSEKVGVLKLSAEIGLEALIKLESPGTKFLHLTD